MIVPIGHQLVYGVVTIAEVEDLATNLNHYMGNLQRACLTWGAVEGVWTREYQRRGAVHYNVWCVVPDRLAAAFLFRWRRYVLRTGSRWGSQSYAESWRGGRFNALAYALNYATKKKSKAYQLVLPEGVAAAGRWWGHFGYAGGWVVLAVSPAAFADLCRGKRAWRKSKGYAPGLESGRYLAWLHGPPNAVRLVEGGELSG